MKSIVLHRLIPLCILFLPTTLGLIAADISLTPACSLADAITSANADAATGSCPAGSGADIIHLSGDITLDAELPQITSDITIEGGGYTISGDNSFRIFYVASGALTINQLTLANGSADEGGAIKNEGVLIISDSSFSDNAAEHFGGAIISDGMLSITDSIFNNSRAKLGGGAIANISGLNIDGSSFTNNSTEYASGGAIANYGSANIASSSFSSNTASFSGGAISNINEMSVVGSKFTNNIAKDSGGGAIFNGSGQLSVAESAFTGNFAEENGGAIDNHTPFEGPLARMSVTNSLFTGNGTERSGGAIINSGESNITGSSFEANLARLFGGAVANYGALNFTNCTLSRNVGIERGGGFHSFGDVTATLQHLTVANNLSKVGGGISVYRQEQEGTVVNLSNSLIANNDGGDCNVVLNQNRANLIADGSCDPALSSDPLLGTPVEPADGSPGYYPLQPGSPAIDAADPDYCEATDQVGTPRPQGAACDIGAIEYGSE